MERTGHDEPGGRRHPIAPPAAYCTRRLTSALQFFGVDINWPTVIVSLITSLIASYIGVRYFTGPKLRAERADAAKQNIRREALELIRKATQYQRGVASSLQRKNGQADANDGAQALRFIQLSSDLTWWRRYSIKRRCRHVFGKRWTATAELRGEPISDDDSVFILTAALLDRSPETGTFSDGLMQRAFESDPSSPLVAKLVRQLERLSRAR